MSRWAKRTIAHSSDEDDDDDDDPFKKKKAPPRRPVEDDDDDDNAFKKKKAPTRRPVDDEPDSPPPPPSKSVSKAPAAVAAVPAKSVQQTARPVRPPLNTASSVSTIASPSPSTLNRQNSNPFAVTAANPFDTSANPFDEDEPVSTPSVVKKPAAVPVAAPLSKAVAKPTPAATPTSRVAESSAPPPQRQSSLSSTSSTLSSPKSMSSPTHKTVPSNPFLEVSNPFDMDDEDEPPTQPKKVAPTAQSQAQSAKTVSAPTSSTPSATTAATTISATKRKGSGAAAKSTTLAYDRYETDESVTKSAQIYQRRVNEIVDAVPKRLTLATLSQPTFNPHSVVHTLTQPLFDLQRDNVAANKVTLTTSTDNSNGTTVTSNVEGYEFNAGPFIALLTATIARTDNLRSTLESQIEEQSKRCAAAEQTHKKQMEVLKGHLSALTTSYLAIDTRINAVSHTSQRIGASLESADTIKRNTQRALELTQHFLSFKSGDKTMISPIFTSALHGDTIQLHIAADLIQTLHQIALDIRSEDTEKATKLIESTSNAIETALLDKFELARAAQSMEEMKHLAKILMNFKGKNVIQRYVFPVVEQLGSSQMSKEIKQSNTIADETYNPFESDTEEEDDDDHIYGSTAGEHINKRLPSQTSKSSVRINQYTLQLTNYYRRVLTLMRAQCAIVSAVFPQPLVVIKAILDLIFLSKIQEAVDLILNDEALTLEEYLMALGMAHEKTFRLIKKLQELIKLIPPTTVTATNSAKQVPFSPKAVTSPKNAPLSPKPTHHRTSSNASITTTTKPANEMSLNLNDYILTIFKPHRDDYVEKELEYVQTTCKNEIATILRDRPRSGQSSGGSGMDERQWLSIVLDSDCIDQILKILLNSLHRIDLLTDTTTTAPDAAMKVFNIILSVITEDLIQTLFQQIIIPNYLPQSSSNNNNNNIIDPKIEPDPYFFTIVRLIVIIITKLNYHHHSFISTRLQSNLNVLAISELRLRENINAIELLILNGLTRILSSALKWINKILIKYSKKSDYTPKDESQLLEGRPTEATITTCLFLKNHTLAAIESLSGKNLDSYLLIFGQSSYDIIINHLIKLHQNSVSTLGAALLVRDVKEYETVARSSFHLNAVIDQFIDLRHIVNLFFVDVSALSAWMAEPRIARMDRTLLHEFIKMRADYSANKAKIVSILRV